MASANGTTHAHESVIIGVAYIVSSLILLLIYVSFNALLKKNREFNSMQAHRLMLFLGVLDCIQLVGHVFGGVATIWRNINDDAPYLCQIVGAMLNSAWNGLFPLSLLIAVQRFFTVRRRVNVNEKFSLAMKVVISLCFAYCFAFFVSLVCIGKVIYSPNKFSWSYGSDTASKFLAKTEVVVSASCVVLTFLVYIAIVIIIYKKKNGIKKMRRNEMQLLVQATILFLLLASIISLWHYHGLVLPETMWTNFSINICWIVYCGLNPILYLIFSKSIRLAYLRFIRILAPKENVVIALQIVVTRSRY
ncbi:hypothetical protein V3C99_016913 [Haemonchus contortus]